MKPAWNRLGLPTLLVLLCVAPAGATVVGGTAAGTGGKFIKLSTPIGNPLGPANSVGQDTFDLPNLYAFDEDQNILLKADLPTDVGRNPVRAGTVVASHYVFFDPGTSQDIFGTVDFDSRVVAIITSTGTLAASDFLANTGVKYLNPGARGLEPGDFVTISGPNQIMFITRASSPGDYVRVLTEFSPGVRVEMRTGPGHLLNFLPTYFDDTAFGLARLLGFLHQLHSAAGRSFLVFG